MIPKVRRAFCSSCGGDRNCEVRGEYLQSGGDDHVDWRVSWLILECRGCDHVFALTISTNSEAVDYDYGPDGETISEAIETLDYWPARAKRPKPDWLAETGMDNTDLTRLDASLAELYGALDNDLLILAGIGLRTAFDIASELLGVEPSLTFEAKLKAVKEGGHIGPSDISHLEKLVDVGSASAHRGWRPSPTQLSTMMGVLEDFVFSAFVEPNRRRQRDAEVKRITVPPKPLRPKKEAAKAPGSPKQNLSD